MLYDLTSGKRVKEPGNMISWVHTNLEKQQGKTFSLYQCLFGEHQLADLPPGSTVALVESEKTAIIMSAILPGYTWVACGGLGMLSEAMCAGLEGYRIVCFPDLGGYPKWQDKVAKHKAAGHDMRVSDLLERVATKGDRAKGLDLADYFVPQLKQPDRRERNQAEQQLSQMAHSNPVLKDLIKTFSLDQTSEGQSVDWKNL